MSIRVLCAGRLYCDLIFTGTPRLPTHGTEVFAQGLTLHAGGGAFITAATLAKLGVEAGLASILPAPPFESSVQSDMRTHRVDASLCEPAVDGQDPQITTAIATDDDRAFVTRASGVAVPDITAKTLKGYQHLHIGELRTLQEHPHLVQAAQSAGVTTSLDCSWQDKFDPNAAQLIETIDVFMPSENEEAALSEVGISKTCAALTVVKCGPKGARARRHGEPDWLTAPTHPVEVVDATGAGDAFNGGFLSRWLVGAALSDCLDTANRCGAIAIQGAGGVRA